MLRSYRLDAKRMWLGLHHDGQIPLWIGDAYPVTARNCLSKAKKTLVSNTWLVQVIVSPPGDNDIDEYCSDCQPLKILYCLTMVVNFDQSKARSSVEELQPIGSSLSSNALMLFSKALMLFNNEEWRIDNRERERRSFRNGQSQSIRILKGTRIFMHTVYRVITGRYLS